MKLIIGLGNPGAKHETNRHNIGFLALDYLVDQWKATGPAAKHQSVYWQTTLAGEQVLLIKPQTFMNLSGRAVAPFFNFYKCAPEDLIVIYDELDIDPLEIRFKTGGSHGGHNGLRSIDECLGGENLNYHRVRLGIGHPRSLNLRIGVSDYVLGQIPEDQWQELEPLFQKVETGVTMVFDGKIKEAMNRFHRKVDSEKISTEKMNKEKEKL